MDKKDIPKLERSILDHESRYRSGNPIISDAEFDAMVNKLQWASPKSPVLKSFLGEVVRGERVELPISMGSLNKLKKLDELKKWILSNKLSNHRFVLSPKYDGISIYSGKIAVTRGDDGEGGTDITKRFLRTQSAGYINDKDIEHRGELTILRKDFNIHNDRLGADTFSSPRSMVMSMLSSDYPDYEILKSLVYVPFHKYGVSIDKDDMFESMYKSTKYKYLVVNGQDILDDKCDFRQIFNDFSVDFEIDGLVIDVCDYFTSMTMGYFKNSSNPKCSFALKFSFEEQKETTIKEIFRSVSRDGRLTPVAIIEPVMLCGDKVSRINLDNDRFMMYHGIGVGSEITVKKSGNVIPRLTKVGSFNIFDNAEFIKLAKKHSSDEYRVMCGLADNYLKATSIEVFWDQNGVFLINNSLGKESTIRGVEHFFDTLGVQNVKSSSISSLYDLGYDDISKIILMDHDVLISENGWGKTKIKNFKEELKKVFSAQKHELMNASGMFSGLGDTKLKLITQSIESGTSISEISNIRDIGEKTAEKFMSNIDKFDEFYKTFEHLMNTSEIQSKEFLGYVVFTGFRDAKLVNTITGLGYKYSESLTKSSTILVYNEDTTTRTKLEKAGKYGVKTMTKREFESIVGGSVLEAKKDQDMFNNNSLF